MNNGTVSIITICKNAKETIAQTMQSVIDQTYTNIQYIILDGASDDGTASLIQSKGRYSTFISEPDHGATYALNKGLRYATGEFVFYLNADDWISPEFIKIAVDNLKSMPNVDFVYSDLTIVGGGSSHLIKAAETYGSKIRYTMPRINYPTIVYRQSVFSKVGDFNTGFSVSPDYEFNLRAYLSGFRGKKIQNVSVFFRDDGNSNRNESRALREVFAASVLHVGNIPMASLWYLAKTIKIFARHLLSQSGLYFLYLWAKKIRYYS